MMTRRKFLQYSFYATSALCLGCGNAASFAKTREDPEEARFYKRLADGSINCLLCFRQCVIPAKQRGFCRNRENRNGRLYSLVYGRPAAIQLDPIEKEPMFHNLPGTDILCIGTASCNFRCRFCHNWHLSQSTPEELASRSMDASPEDIVRLARQRKAGLSFTYNEPTVFYEFMFDIARKGRESGLNTIFHTNGGMQAEPLKALLKHMRGVTVDVKGFTADYYKDVSFAEMKPVLDTLKIIKEEGKWLEIVNLVIPALNDDMKNIREMCIWIKKNLGEDVPLHFIRFFPSYKMNNLPPTPIKTLENARDAATKEGMKFVYVGNVPGHTHNSTFCPACKKKIISRVHFSVIDLDVKGGKCKHCGCPIPGLWD